LELNFKVRTRDGGDCGKIVGAKYGEFEGFWWRLGVLKLEGHGGLFE